MKTSTIGFDTELGAVSFSYVLSHYLKVCMFRSEASNMIVKF